MEEQFILESEDDVDALLGRLAKDEFYRIKIVRKTNLSLQPVLDVLARHVSLRGLLFGDDFEFAKQPDHIPPYYSINIPQLRWLYLHDVDVDLVALNIVEDLTLNRVHVSDAFFERLRTNRSLKDLSVTDPCDDFERYADAIRDNPVLSGLRMNISKPEDIPVILGLPHIRHLTVRWSFAHPVDPFVERLHQYKSLRMWGSSNWDYTPFLDAIAKNTSLEQIYLCSGKPVEVAEIEKIAKTHLHIDDLHIGLSGLPQGTRLRRRLFVLAAVQNDGPLRRFLRLDGDHAVLHRVRDCLVDASRKLVDTALF